MIASNDSLQLALYFAVMDHRRKLNGLDEYAVTDVWFSARTGVEYLQATFLNGIIQQNRREIESNLNVDIIMVRVLIISRH